MRNPVAEVLQAIVLTGFPFDSLCALSLLAERIDTGGTPAYAQLCDGMGLSYPSARRVLLRMEADGLVERNAPACAARQGVIRRRLSLRITDRGRAVLARLSSVVGPRPAVPPAAPGRGGAASTVSTPPVASTPAATAPQLSPTVREWLVDSYGRDVVALAEQAVRCGTPVARALAPLVAGGHLAAARATMLAHMIAPSAPAPRTQLAPTALAEIVTRGVQPAPDSAHPAPDRGSTRVPLATPDALPAELRTALPAIRPATQVEHADAAVDLARTVAAEAATRYRGTLSTAPVWLPEVVWSITRGELADIGALSLRVRAALRLVASSRWRRPKNMPASEVAVLVG